MSVMQFNAAVQALCDHQDISGTNIGEFVRKDGDIDVFVSELCVRCSQYLGIVHYISSPSGEVRR